MLKVKSVESKITICELKPKVRKQDSQTRLRLFMLDGGKQDSQNRLRLFMLDGGKPNFVLIIMTLFWN